MGLEYYLVKEASREAYDLGKFTRNWDEAIGGVDTAGNPCVRFVVDRDADAVAARMIRDWEEHGLLGEDPGESRRYLGLVARDVVRWAGADLVTFTTDASHTSVRQEDFPGSDLEDVGADSWLTGSRYATDRLGLFSDASPG